MSSSPKCRGGEGVTKKTNNKSSAPFSHSLSALLKINFPLHGKPFRILPVRFVVSSWGNFSKSHFKGGKGIFLAVSFDHRSPTKAIHSLYLMTPKSQRRSIYFMRTLRTVKDTKQRTIKRAKHGHAATLLSLEVCAFRDSFSQLLVLHSNDFLQALHLLSAPTWSFEFRFVLRLREPRKNVKQRKTRDEHKAEKSCLHYHPMSQIKSIDVLRVMPSSSENQIHAVC